MTPKKDIETEINKYLKGNYSKKVAFELLKREGFTAEELQPFSKHFDTLNNNSDNSLSFFPGFLFLLLSSLLSSYLLLSQKEQTRRFICWVSKCVIYFDCSLFIHHRIYRLIQATTCRILVAFYLVFHQKILHQNQTRLKQQLHYIIIHYIPIPYWNNFFLYN